MKFCLLLLIFITVDCSNKQCGYNLEVACEAFFDCMNGCKKIDPNDSPISIRDTHLQLCKDGKKYIDYQTTVNEMVKNLKSAVCENENKLSVEECNNRVNQCSDNFAKVLLQFNPRHKDKFIDHY
ncbi:uncharacterized protein LOC126899691 [Daktulosphaira vitifoliae]|uniref:uncharacterized protein LOC126899691 n=1 Tax=Daktulosphaira vitifoliae TaxID=58002 RepID=UPI0021A98697|nr:uncharacterized protein LOC126899691 [Daktulosphaira vitifoliae]